MTVLELKKRLDKAIQVGYENFEVVGNEEIDDYCYTTHIKDDPVEFDLDHKQMIFKAEAI